MPRSRSRSSRHRVHLLLLLGATLLATACDDGDDPVDEGDTAEVTVMTRNLYLGADIFRLTQATSAQAIPVIAAEVFATMQANDFEARAGALAAEVAATEPHLIGLQEVTLYRIQDPSDYVTGTTGANATDVYLDLLEVLLDSLDARGLDYEVASQVQNADVELPAARSPTEFFDVRLTDRDVILARSDVATTEAASGGYAIAVPFELASGDTIWFQRGYTSVDATVDGVDFVFLDTHLEVSAGGALEQVQTAQAIELTQRFGGESPIIAVGDFNTQEGEQPYGVLTGTFTDAWTSLGTGGPGLTCCQPERLDQSQDFYERIDLILFAGPVDVLSADVVGDQPADRTAGGLWPSDHAGVVATLRIGE